MIFFRKAILIIHGYAGGTYDMEPLANHLEKSWGIDVYSFTLPGHEKRTIKTITYDMWINESENQLKKLIEYGYKSIYVIGHSMGGVIASYLASKYSNIKKVVLVAPAFRYLVNTEEAKTFELLKSGIGMAKKADKGEIITRFLKLPISSVSEFQDLVDKYKDKVYDIKIPILFIQGLRDELVPKDGTIEIYEKLVNKKKYISLLDDATHNVFKSNDCDKAIQEIENFLK